MIARKLCWWKAVPLVLALPALGGAGICGVAIVDITQRDLILDPIDTITFEVDSGSIEVTTLDRNGTSLFYYMVGSLYDIGVVGHEVDDHTLVVTSLCDRDDFCNVNWTADVPLTTAVEVVAHNGAVKLIAAGAAVTAEIEGGGLEGVELGVPTIDANVEGGDVNLAWLVAPTRVDLVVGEGNVALTLPAGSYRCELDAADGEIDTGTITCDDTATAVLHVEVELGNITLATEMP